jgi:hypothetical protein
MSYLKKLGWLGSVRVMRYSQSEKMEIIRLVEESDLPIKRALDELHVHQKCAKQSIQRSPAIIQKLMTGLLSFWSSGLLV